MTPPQQRDEARPYHVTTSSGKDEVLYGSPQACPLLAVFNKLAVQQTKRERLRMGQAVRSS